MNLHPSEQLLEAIRFAAVFGLAILVTALLAAVFIELFELGLQESAATQPSRTASTASSVRFSTP